MNYLDFEKLTKRTIEERLAKEFPGKRIVVEHQKELISNSGNTYKIDLSYTFDLFDMNYLTLIECKCWNSYVTRDKVNVLKAIVEDLKASKGILITSKGFQKGAIEYAISQNIGLIKIINDNNFEVINNFDGGLARLSEMLIKEDDLDSNTNTTSIGLFSSSTNLNDFIRIHYGNELMHFIEHEFEDWMLDDSSVKLNPIVKEQLAMLPNNWYQQYYKLETAGLSCSIENTSDVRMMSSTLHLLKTTKLSL